MAGAGDAGLRARGAGAGAAGCRLELEEGAAAGVGVGVRREVDAVFSPAGLAAAPAGGGPQRDLRGAMPPAGGLPEAEGLAGGGLGFFIASAKIWEFGEWDRIPGASKTRVRRFCLPA